jgi:nucleoside-diphosphate-sugar epimerase
MILVTGATGLVGSHLTYELLISGQQVKAIKRPNSNIENTKRIFSYYNTDFINLFEKIEWIDADIINYPSLINAMNNCEYVYHAAAMVSFAPEDKEALLQNNIQGTANIVNACLEKNIKKLCYVSSIAALGKSLNKEPITENTEWRDSEDISTYSKSKFHAECEVWKGIEKGLNAVIVNPTVILGPGNWESGSAALFNTVWKGLQFYTTGITGFVDVRDVARIMILLMNSNIHSQKYLLNSENYSYKDLLSVMAIGFGKPVPKFRVTKLIAEIAWRLEFIRCKITGKTALITKETTTAARKQNVYSNEKIKKLLQYEFISVEKTIQYTCEILRKEKAGK